MGFAGALGAEAPATGTQKSLPWVPILDDGTTITYVVKRVGASNANAALRMFPMMLQLNDGGWARKVMTSGTTEEAGREARVPLVEENEDGSTSTRIQRAARAYVMSIVYRREGAKLPPKSVMVRRAGEVVKPGLVLTADEVAARFAPATSTSIQRKTNTVNPIERALMLQARAAEFKPAGEERFRENLLHVQRALQPGEYTTNAAFTPNLLDDATWAGGAMAKAAADVDVGVETSTRGGRTVTPARAHFELFKHRHEVHVRVKLGSGTYVSRVATGTLRSLFEESWRNNADVARIGMVLTRGNQSLHTVLVFDKQSQAAMRAWLGTMENARFGKVPRR